MHLKHTTLSQAFQSLDRLLIDYRALWSESAFVRDELSWSAEYPVLYQELLNLSDRDVLALEDERTLLSYLASYLPRLGNQPDWQGPCENRAPWHTPRKALFGLPERKKNQTEGFVSAVLQHQSFLGAKKIVDWCSGRGYLARQLHYSSASPVHCLEIDSKLCQSGQLAHEKMDQKMAKEVVFHQQDVRQTVKPELMADSSLHTALHACGELHISMLRQVVEAKVPNLACSPCCYHSIDNEVYQALSKEARRSTLRPSKSELRLATAELSTANSTERKLRQCELLWRTAFDLRLREKNGLTKYTPSPSVKKSLLKTSFQDFAQSTLNRLSQKGQAWSFFPISETEEKELLRKAESKLSRIRRLEKAQLGFRQALEYWLLLDRALFLQEHRYEVELRTFCQKEDSGRNVMILASLPG